MKNVISYQAYFTSNPTSSEKNLFLTFFFKGNPIAITEDKNLLPLLNKSTQVAENSFKIPNIVDILVNVETNLREQFSSFFIVLFTEKVRKKKEGKEKGLLFGKSVQFGTYILGLWPYPFFIESEQEQVDFLQLITDITTNTKNFSEILLLTEK